MNPAGRRRRTESWKLLANCKNADPNLFHLKKGQSAAPGKAICKDCKVKDPCLEYGIRNQCVGIWGGRVLTLKEEAIELYPVTPLQDSTMQKVPLQTTNVPAILGKEAVNFKRFPSILGTRSFYYQPDTKATDGP